MKTKNFLGANPGPQVSVSELPEVSAFDIFFTPAILQNICDLTNESFAAKFAKNPAKHKGKFPKIDVPELRAFLGVVIGIGLLQVRGSIRKYWSDECTLIDTPGIRAIFSRTRFTQILRYLHYVDEQNVVTDRANPDYDNMYKVRMFFATLIPRFRSAYSPEQNLSLDESVIPGQSRMPARQFLKNKPDRWGQKLFVVSEAKSGYVLNIEIYSGKTKGVSDEGATHDVVLRLMEPFYYIWHHVYMDRYYSSPTAYLALEAKAVLACGTVMPNRKGVPKDITNKSVTKKMKRGESNFRQCKNTRMVAVTWKDSKTVTVLSTIPCDFATSPVKRLMKGATGWSAKDVPRPNVIGLYNANMGGVDMGNKKIKAYRRRFKGFRWPNKVFLYLVDATILNAHILYTQCNPTVKLTLRQYRVRLCMQLINGNTFRYIPPTPHAPAPEMRLNRQLNHAPMKYAKPGWCVVHEQRVDTTFGCKICNVKMCPVPCFEMYHYQLDYAFNDPARQHKTAARKKPRAAK